MVNGTVTPPHAAGPAAALRSDAVVCIVREYLSGVIVVEVTSTIRNIPVEVSLGRAEGLRRRSVANLDNVHVVPTRRLSSRIGTLYPQRIPEVKRALGYALGWPELKQL